jgi:hypothetical protein
MGIPQRNIEEEVTIDYNGKQYRVDLVGYPSIKNNIYANEFRIAIECGDNKAEKIEALRDTFPLVLILPYKEFDMLDEAELKIFKKMLKSYEQQMIENHYYLEQIHKVKTEVEQCKSAVDTFAKQYRTDCIDAIEKELNSVKAELSSVKAAVDIYKQDLKLLSEFKFFCERFGGLSLMPQH